MEQEKLNENIPNKDKKEKNKFLKGALCGALIAFAAMFLFTVGMKIKNNDSVINKGTEHKLKLIGDLIDDKYLNSDEIDIQTMKDSLIKGYVNGLGDPYSEYYDKEETKELEEATSGEFSGIGVAMQQNRETGMITFSKVYKDSPAEKAGFKDGDILYKVEDEDISSLSLNEIVGKVKGEEGTEVKLTVLRGEEGKEITGTAVRKKIEAQTIEYEMKEDKIGYIRISEFDKVTGKQFENALNTLKEQGAQGFIFDVRGNPGGNLSTVCEMLDLILPKGKIVYIEDKDGNKEEYKSDGKRFLDLPLTVLADGQSASASEIFAGAIQDYGIGKIVGTTTYGKGVVQQIFPMTDGTSVKLTIAEYFTPKGRNIHGKGIEPDVEVAYEADAENPEKDNQLDRAIEILKNERKKVK